MERVAASADRGGDRSLLGRAVAVLIFLLLAGVRWWISGIESQPGWLLRAGEIAAQISERGGSLLHELAAAEDPRVGPAALLHLAGLGESVVAPLFSVLAVLVAAAGVHLTAGIAFSVGRTRWSLGALLLAVSPLWIESALQADPYVALGTILLVLVGGRGRLWWRVALLAWAMGWTPWAWLTLLPLALGRLWGPAPQRARNAALSLVAVVALWLLNPPALLAPGEWLRGMLWRAAAGGIGGASAGLTVAQGSWPLAGSLHLVGAALLLWAARDWPARLRRGQLAPLALFVVVLLLAWRGFAVISPLLIVLPWAASESGRAAHQLRLGGERGSILLRWGLCLAIGVPLLWVGVERARRPGGAAGEEAAIAWAERELPAGSLIAYEVGIHPPAGSRHHWLAIPYHSVDPSIHRGAHWEGWFAACDAALLSEQRILRYLRTPERFPEMLSFYVALKDRAGEERTFGSRVGRRTRLLRFRADRERPLAPGWRSRVAAGPASGLSGEFLASLAGGLAQAGLVGGAVTLLEEALTAGYDAPGIYLNLASAHLASGRVYEAGRVLDEGVRRYPDSPELLYNLGVTLTRAGMWERAVRTLARVRELWPRSADAAFLLAYALANRGERASAGALLREALELDPDLAERPAVRELEDHLREVRP